MLYTYLLTSANTDPYDWPIAFFVLHYDQLTVRARHIDLTNCMRDVRGPGTTHYDKTCGHITRILW